MIINTNEPFTLKGKSTLRAWRSGSQECVYEQTVSNLIVTSGKALVAELLMGDDSVGLTFHALGTSATAPASGDTDLGAEATRKAWSSVVRTGRVITFSVFYLASEATYNVKECGVFGGAAASSTPGSGTLFSHYLQPYDNSGGLVDLTFEYELEVL